MIIIHFVKYFLKVPSIEILGYTSKSPLQDSVRYGVPQELFDNSPRDSSLVFNFLSICYFIVSCWRAKNLWINRAKWIAATKVKIFFIIYILKCLARVLSKVLHYLLLKDLNIYRLAEFRCSPLAQLLPKSPGGGI